MIGRLIMSESIQIEMVWAALLPSDQDMQSIHAKRQAIADKQFKGLFNIRLTKDDLERKRDKERDLEEQKRFGDQQLSTSLN